MQSNKTRISDFAAVVGVFTGEEKVENTSIYLEITAAKFEQLKSIGQNLENSTLVRNADAYFRNLCLFDSELGDTQDLIGDLQNTNLAAIPSVMTKNLKNIWKSHEKFKWKIEIIKESGKLFLKFIGENRIKQTQLTTEKFLVENFDPKLLYEQFYMQFESKQEPCCAKCENSNKLKFIY